MTTKKTENLAEKPAEEKKQRKTATRKTTTRKTTTTRKSSKKHADVNQEDSSAVNVEQVMENNVEKSTDILTEQTQQNATESTDDTVTDEVKQSIEAKTEAKASKAEAKASKADVVVDSEKPVVDSEKSVVDSEKPVADSEKPVVDSEKPVSDEVNAKVKVSTKEEKIQNSAPKEPKPVPPLPKVRIESIVDLINAPHRQLLLSDQQIQQLTLSEAEQRFRCMEGILAWIFNYDVVISDTNIWIELLVGHTSNHSDPKVNARLLFERQLEFISKLTRFRKAKFLMMSQTYEEIDRFATAQAPTNYKEADFTDETVCRNIAARLAKRLILSQQRENRLKIEGITSESHHAAFADPAIIRRTVELFAEGKRVLLLTNDTSVGIRSIGMCDDLQRINGIDDETWEQVYTPIRPMVFTMDDLKLIDNYTRQYHFLQMAAGKQWMEDVPQSMEKRYVEPLMLWLDGFRSGDKYPESRVVEQQKKQQQQNNQQRKQQSKSSQQQKTEQKPVQPKQEPKAQQPKQEPKVQQPKQEPKVQQPKQEPKPQQSKQEPKPVQPKQESSNVPHEQEIVVEKVKETTEAKSETAEVKETVNTEQNPAPTQKKRTYRRPQRGRKPKEAKENQ